MARRLLVFALLLGLSISGCAHNRETRAPDPASPSAPASDSTPSQKEPSHPVRDALWFTGTAALTVLLFPVIVVRQWIDPIKC